MSAGRITTTEILAAYDELQMLGTAPPLDAFLAQHPEHPGLRERLLRLQRLRRDLDRLSGTPNDEELPAPEMLPQGFRVLRPLGRGGMGVVWAAEQQSPKRLCALKLLHHSNPDTAQRFVREADLAARLTHPGIATVYAFATTGAAPFLATEFVHGFSLRALLSVADLIAPENPGLWLSDALRWLVESGQPSEGAKRGAPAEFAVITGLHVAEALAHAHSRGVIHRDVKPSNIMVTLDGHTKLIDFGIAMPLGTPDPRLTMTGAFIGSFGYAAPEQLRGEHDAIGPWTDTYALGATLFETLTQRSPFEAPDLASRIAQLDAAPPHGPRHFNPSVSLALDELVRHALEPDPARRFQDGDSMAQALRGVRETPRFFAFAAVAPSLWRRLRPLVGLALGVVTSVVVGALYIHSEHQRSDERVRAAEHAQTLTQAIVDTALRGAAGELDACVTYRPVPRGDVVFIADAELHDGRLVHIQPSSNSEHMTNVAQRCMLGVINRLPLPTLPEPIDVRVEHRVRSSDDTP